MLQNGKNISTDGEATCQKYKWLTFLWDTVYISHVSDQPLLPCQRKFGHFITKYYGKKSAIKQQKLR